MAVLHKHHADFTVLKRQTQETVLHRLLIREEPPGPQVAASYEESLAFLLSTADSGLKSQVDKIINRKDVLGNTALHYATQKWSQVREVSPRSICCVSPEHSRYVNRKRTWSW